MGSYIYTKVSNILHLQPGKWKGRIRPGLGVDTDIGIQDTDTDANTDSDTDTNTDSDTGTKVYNHWTGLLDFIKCPFPCRTEAKHAYSFTEVAC